MASINRVTLLGNLGRDPEIRTLNNGKAAASLSIGTSVSKKQGDEWVSETQWHRVVAYDKQAAAVGSMSKGQMVFVDGRLNYRKYTNKEGVEQNVTEIGANEIHAISKAEAKQAASESEEIPF